MIVNVITKSVMKLEHPEDLSFFYECRTFLYKKMFNGYVRVLDLSSFLPPLLNNVGLKQVTMNSPEVPLHKYNYFHFGSVFIHFGSRPSQRFRCSWTRFAFFP